MSCPLLFLGARLPSLDFEPPLLELPLPFLFLFPDEQGQACPHMTQQRMPSGRLTACFCDMWAGKLTRLVNSGTCAVFTFSMSLLLRLCRRIKQRMFVRNRLEIERKRRSNPKQTENVPLEFGWNWRLQRHTFSLGLRHIHRRHVKRAAKRRHSAMVGTPETRLTRPYSHWRCQREVRRHGRRNVKWHWCKMMSTRRNSSVDERY